MTNLLTTLTGGREQSYMIPESKNLTVFEKELQKYDYIRLVLADINGSHVSQLLSTRRYASIIKNECYTYSGIIGMGMRSEMSYFPEIQRFNLGNGCLIPDYTTLMPLPWLADEVASSANPNSLSMDKYRSLKMAEIICDQIWPNGGPIEASPRFIARQQLDNLRNQGFRLYSAFEPEFRVFKQAPKYEVVEQGIDYLRTTTMNRFQPTLIRADTQLQQVGIEINEFIKEYGSSQIESPLAAKIGIQSADMFFQFRQAIKEIFYLDGYQVSFMTKPLPNESSSGAHFNHSLVHVQTGEPVMFEETAENKLSETARHWIGGLLKHGQALAALTAPTVNCYRRFRDGGFAPTYADWAIDNRLRSIRVKNNGPSGTYVELRMVSSAASPYIVMAATIAAGLDGLENRIEPPDEVTESPDRPVSGEAAARFKKLPTSLGEALDCLEADSAMVDALGGEFISWFIGSRREHCLKVLADVNLDDDSEEAYRLERERYFDFV